MLRNLFQYLFRHTTRAVGVTIAITAVSLASTLIGIALVSHLERTDHGAAAAVTHPLQRLSFEASNHGWGKQALILVHADLLASMGIPPANACGMGATSCFKCHDGRQAKEPDTQPWHLQHIPVNYSCNGCHGGNPRLMNESIAHSGMLPNPLGNTQKSCASCHTNSKQLTAYVADYKKIFNKKD